MSPLLWVAFQKNASAKCMYINVCTQPACFSSAYDTAVSFKLQGHVELLRIQPFQWLIHNSSLSDLHPVSPGCIVSFSFQHKSYMCFFTCPSQTVEASENKVIHEYTKVPFSIGSICCALYRHGWENTKFLLH